MVSSVNSSGGAVSRAEKTCLVDGCSKPANGSKGMCLMHYTRQLRYGTTERVRKLSRFEHTNGYVLIPARGHPMAVGYPHAYEHRVVYYDAHGGGPFSCHWCGTNITWAKLHIDHLDDNKKNNKLENLAASCAECNKKRGAWKSLVTLREQRGIEAFGTTRLASEWAREYGISHSAIARRLAVGWSAEDAVSTPPGRKPSSAHQGVGNGG